MDREVEMLKPQTIFELRNFVSFKKCLNKMKLKIKALDPTQFENLVFDMLLEKGMSNLVWRTPGADGGRDIEGTFSVLDISGYVLTQRWYIECKRYKASVDWPTIYGKLAYADNHGADYLLMATSSSYSPNAITETERWNKKGLRPQIRLWPVSQLEIELKSAPNTAYKYGFEKNLNSSALPYLTLVKEIAKQLAISESIKVFNDVIVEKEILAAKELAWLVYGRVSQKDEHGFFTSSLRHEDDDSILIGNYKYSGIISVDLFSLRAMVAYIALGDGMNSGEVIFEKDKATIIPDKLSKFSPAQLKVIESIASWGNLYVTYNARGVTVNQQEWLI